MLDNYRELVVAALEEEMLMTMPTGAQPDTVHEAPMTEGGMVAEATISMACEAAVESAVSQREQAGRPAGL